VALVGLIVVLLSVLSIQRALTKSPIKGPDIAGVIGGGSETSRRQAACPAAPSATILLFGQLSGHMNLVTGIGFGNVVRRALIFSDGRNFRFCAIQGISRYADRVLSEAGERNQRAYRQRQVILRFSWCFSF
jgi:hypothetical protein